ncbi:hypothetical protein T492DRAFT_942885 [Pavlovales sp. CCMP2436]|nr:hypothetical protein T492DRAFT_942885 [Pavlovales sp. CCMP2436]|mmetsp:Transcript_208/g.552  ORF Transcript_208/g.552 Transcript_208/m.552 type:complete len:321 (+) Transcript_208:231-1193(+)
MGKDQFSHVLLLLGLTMMPRPETPGTREYWFVRDDHASAEQYQRLTADITRFRGGELWVEFAYESELELLRSASGLSDKERASTLAQVLSALSANGWSAEYNQAVLDLLLAALANEMQVHALDSREWSREAFVAKFGPYRGGLKYITNRASPLDDGVSASSRWARKVAIRHAESLEPVFVVVIGGAEHGPVMIQILRDKYAMAMTLLHEEEDSVRQIAYEKLRRLLREATHSRLPTDTDDDDDEGGVLAILEYFTRAVRLRNSLSPRRSSQTTSRSASPSELPPAGSSLAEEVGRLSVEQGTSRDDDVNEGAKRDETSSL